jgi:hypothetical protein
VKINPPVVLQVAGAALLFAVRVGRVSTGFLPSFGLISGAALAYVGKHFADLVR